MHRVSLCCYYTGRPRHWNKHTEFARCEKVVFVYNTRDAYDVLTYAGFVWGSTTLWFDVGAAPGSCVFIIYFTSKRSRSMTLAHAATKSSANFSFTSSCA